MLRLAALLFAVLAVLLQDPSARAAEHTKDKPETVRQRVVKKDAVLVDVREEKEWKAGHLKRARLIPLSRLRDKEAVKAFVEKLPKEKPVYLHCRSGGRCLIAADVFEKHGLDVRPLKQGYGDLLEAGFEKAASAE